MNSTPPTDSAMVVQGRRNRYLLFATIVYASAAGALLTASSVTAATFALFPIGLSAWGAGYYLLFISYAESGKSVFTR